VVEAAGAPGAATSEEVGNAESASRPLSGFW
jgi:hypothetical protein